jgi:hypothetical protein
MTSPFPFSSILPTAMVLCLDCLDHYKARVAQAGALQEQGLRACFGGHQPTNHQILDVIRMDGRKVITNCRLVTRYNTTAS